MKNALHYSHIQMPKNNPSTAQSMNYSCIGNPSSKFKYQRIGNMFKLVQVHNMEDLDPKNDTKDNDRIGKLQQAVQVISQKVKNLEIQVPKLDGKMGDLLMDIDSLTFQNNRSDQQLNYVVEQVKELRGEVQLISEQQFGKDKDLERIQIQVRNFHEILNCKIQAYESHLDAFSENLNQKLNQDIKNLVFQLKKELDMSTRIQEQSPKIKAKKIYSLKYQEIYEHEGVKYLIDEVVYRVDQEGRLLDKDGYWLLDENNREVRLDDDHMRKLKDFALLKQ